LSATVDGQSFGSIAALEEAFSAGDLTVEEVQRARQRLGSESGASRTTDIGGDSGQPDGPLPSVSPDLRGSNDRQDSGGGASRLVLLAVAAAVALGVVAS
jgi:hypothetical protein